METIKAACTTWEVICVKFPSTVLAGRWCRKEGGGRMLKPCWYALLLVVIVELQPILFLCTVLREPFLLPLLFQ